jgi:hypothetical protein
MKLKLDVYPLFMLVGTSVSLATGFGLHNLFRRSEVKIWKKDRMREFPINK